jgi:7-keto-8-aminopelargonate synthetase-like enzyme
MFSHNGTLAPLGEYLATLPRGSKIVVDDAHGAGTLGTSGRGTCEALGIRSDDIIQTISLSKAFGAYGGAILGPKALRQKLLKGSRILRGNTPLPLPLASAATRSLGLLRSDKTLRARLLDNTAFVKERLPAQKAEHHAELTPVVAVCPEGPAKARRLRDQLLGAGIYPTEISYVDDEAYFRFALSSEHERKQLERLVEVLQAFSR